MQLTIDRKDLLGAVARACRVVPTRSPKPILANLRLDAAGGLVGVLATDLEVAIRCTVGCTGIEEPGSVLMPADELQSILRETPDDTVRLAGPTTESAACTVQANGSAYQIPTGDPAEFPAIPEWGTEAGVKLPGATVSTAIRRTLFAVAKERMRYATNGALLEYGDKRLAMVATDGRRLAWTEHQCEKLSAAAQKAILPQAVMRELLGLAAAEQPVSVRINESQALFRVGSTLLCSRLIDGHFPDYKAVIPKDNATQVTVPRAALLSAVRRAAIATTVDSAAVRLELAPGKLTLHGVSAERGTAQIELPVAYDGEATLTVALNPAFLTDMLSAVDAETLRVELTAPDKPVLIRAGEGYQYLVMPVATA